MNVQDRSTRFAGRMLAVVFLSLVASIECARANPAQRNEDVAAVYGADSMISLATGYVQPLSRAPATASVLTRTDITALGIRTLKDALDFLPGFQVSFADGRTTFLTVRGITSRALILVDNIPVTRTMIDPWVALDNILLHNVERIEAVRGPGSAIYGADAVAGVINVLTRTNTHLPIKEVGAGVGWNNTYDVWALSASNFGKLKLSAYAAFSTSDGSDRTIEIDAQSLLDQRLGTTASRAPGRIAQDRRSLDLRVDAVLGYFTAQLTYYDQDPLQTGAGVAYALDPTGEWNALYQSANVRFRREFSDALLLEGFIDYSEVKQDADTYIFPPGAFGNTFPEGVISSFLISNERMRAEATAITSALRRHKVRFGLGALSNEFDNAKDVRNFIVRNNRFLPTGLLAPFGGVGDAGLIGDIKQDVIYAYLQDEWNLADHWRLTTGVRWDHYSDLGSTVNPRIGLVWNARHNLTAKALYGQSFRPPSVLESQSSGVFSALGNPNLQPTTLEMAELGLEYRGSRVEESVAVFRYKQDDLIQVIPNAASPNGTGYVNRGQSEGWGFEGELAWHLSPASKTSLSYAFHDRIGHESDNNSNNRFAPHHILTFQMLLPITSTWRSALTARAVLDRERAISDPRPNPKNYAIANLSVSRPGLFGMLDAAFTVNNLFDEDIHEASPSASSLPLDIPLPGRTWFIELKWRH